MRPQRALPLVHAGGPNEGVQGAGATGFCPPDVPAHFGRLVEAVREQAQRCGGYYRLPLVGSEAQSCEAFLDVPRNPFLLWVLRGFAFERFGKPRPFWETVISPRGLKTPGDDPLHSDWMVGAGLACAFRGLRR